MHQSPDGTMYWLAGQEGMLLKVGVGRYHHPIQIYLKYGRIMYVPPCCCGAELELYGVSTLFQVLKLKLKTPNP